MATQGYARPPFSPTRFPAGITTANKGDVLANLATIDPTKVQIFWEDFISAPAILGQFNSIDGAGGLATVDTDAVVGTPTACFGVTLNRRFFFTARLSMANISNANSVVLGFADDLTIPNNGVVVSIINNELVVYNYNDGVLTDTAKGTIHIDSLTMFDVGFEYSPGKGVTVYLNGGVVTRIRPKVFTEEWLGAGIIPTGDSITLDYIFAAVER